MAAISLGRSAGTLVSMQEDSASLAKFLKFVQANCPIGVSKIRTILVDKDFAELRFVELRVLP